MDKARQGFVVDGNQHSGGITALLLVELQIG
jgi:hypothetical protein